MLYAKGTAGEGDQRPTFPFLFFSFMLTDAVACPLWNRIISYYFSLFSAKQVANWYSKSFQELLNFEDTEGDSQEISKWILTHLILLNSIIIFFLQI